MSSCKASTHPSVIVTIGHKLCPIVTMADGCVDALDEDIFQSSLIVDISNLT